MQQEAKTRAFWKRCPGVTLLIGGILVSVAGEVADSTIVIAFGLFFMMVAGLVGCLQIGRFMVREMTPRVQAENDTHAKQIPTSKIKPVDEMVEEPRSDRVPDTVTEAKKREEDLRQFLGAVEREELRQFVDATFAQKAIAEAGREMKHSALRKEVGVLIEDFKLTHDPALQRRIQALNREADRFKP
jgi:hypothetical protein